MVGARTPWNALKLFPKWLEEELQQPNSSSCWVSSFKRRSLRATSRSRTKANMMSTLGVGSAALSPSARPGAAKSLPVNIVGEIWVCTG